VCSDRHQLPAPIDRSGAISLARAARRAHAALEPIGPWVVSRPRYAVTAGEIASERACPKSPRRRGECRNVRRSTRLEVYNERDAEGSAVSDGNQTVKQGDVIEFTLRGERRTAEAMLVTDDGVVLLDLFDGERPGWGRVSLLEDVIVYRPDGDESLVAA